MTIQGFDESIGDRLIVMLMSFGTRARVGSLSRHLSFPNWTIVTTLSLSTEEFITSTAA